MSTTPQPEQTLHGSHLSKPHTTPAPANFRVYYLSEDNTRVLHQDFEFLADAWSFWGKHGSERASVWDVISRCGKEGGK